MMMLLKSIEFRYIIKNVKLKKRSLSMRIVEAIENMTASNRKLMYMCNTRPVLKTGALFSDVTEEYRIPAEPQRGIR